MVDLFRFFAFYDNNGGVLMSSVYLSHYTCIYYYAVNRLDNFLSVDGVLVSTALLEISGYSYSLRKV